jgi:hypothetical protein
MNIFNYILKYAGRIEERDSWEITSKDIFIYFWIINDLKKTAKDDLMLNFSVYLPEELEQGDKTRLTSRYKVC